MFLLNSMYFKILIFIILLVLFSFCSSKNADNQSFIPYLVLSDFNVTSKELTSANKNIWSQTDSVLMKKVSAFTKKQKQKDYFKNNSNLGLLALILKEDGSFAYNIFGNSKLNVPLNLDMVFGIGSNTKTLTSILVMKLLEQKQLSLDDTLQQHLPGRINSFIKGNVTIRQLLNHTSGIYDPVGSKIENMFTSPTKVYTVNEILSDVNVAPTTVSTGSYEYSNTNYILLGLIIEKITSKTYHEYLRETIFNSLGLNSSFVSLKESKPNLTLAYSWVKQDSGFSSMKNISRNSFDSYSWSSGAIFSTAKDMAVFYFNLFNGKILSSSTLEQLKKSVNKKKDNDLYGFGIMKKNYKGRDFYFHGGQIPAYESIFSFDTKTKNVYVLFSNSLNPNPTDSDPKFNLQTALFELVDEVAK